MVVLVVSGDVDEVIKIVGSVGTVDVTVVDVVVVDPVFFLL